MRQIATLIIFVFILILSNVKTAAFGQAVPTPTPPIEYNLPYPGILPDHPLYPLKALRDRILIFFTQDPVKKVHLNLLFADKRLVMGQILWEKGSPDLSISTLSKSEKYLLSAALDLLPLKKQNNLPPGLADKLELAAKKHEELILHLLESTADESKKRGLNESLGVNHQATQQILLVK